MSHQRTHSAQPHHMMKILNPEEEKSRIKPSNLTILTLLLNLTDANIVFNGVQHTYLC